MLRTRAILFGFLIATAAGPLSAQDENQDEHLDAIKFYAIDPTDPVDAEASTELQGPFDELTVTAGLIRLTHFGTAARLGCIDDEPANNADEADNWDARYTLYCIVQQEKFEPVRTVHIRNRFGEHKMSLGNANFLLVPAAQGGGDPSPDLDAFKCYSVLVGSGGSRAPIRIEDQYSTVDEYISGAVLFCVPVSLDGGELANPDNHLVIYHLPRKAVDIETSVTDRFGSYDIHLRQSVLLGIPTERLSVFPPPRTREPAENDEPDMVLRTKPHPSAMPAWLQPGFAMLQRLLAEDR